MAWAFVPKKNNNFPTADQAKLKNSRPGHNHGSFGPPRGGGFRPGGHPAGKVRKGIVMGIETRSWQERSTELGSVSDSDTINECGLDLLYI